MISGVDRSGLNLYHGYSFVKDRISKNIFNFESVEGCIQNHQKHLIKFKKAHGLLINGNHKAVRQIFYFIPIFWVYLFEIFDDWKLFEEKVKLALMLKNFWNKSQNN